MRHNGIQVRAATPDDVDVLTRFSGHVRDLPASRRHSGRPLAGPDLSERYSSLLANPTRRVFLAVDDKAGPVEEVLGMAVLAVDVAGELLDIPVVRVSHLVVDRAHRRRGAGRALVTAAAAYAEELGLDHVAVGALTTDREANRFFARLGFAPVLVRRVASLSVLRRELA
ncbi:MAG: GNAT family N-acetyltransferase, partial [Mycobacteriales bacterium]